MCSFRSISSSSSSLISLISCQISFSLGIPVSLCRCDASSFLFVSIRFFISSISVFNFLNIGLATNQSTLPARTTQKQSASSPLRYKTSPSLQKQKPISWIIFKKSPSVILNSLNTVTCQQYGTSFRISSLVRISVYLSRVLIWLDSSSGTFLRFFLNSDDAYGFTGC